MGVRWVSDTYLTPGWILPAVPPRKAQIPATVVRFGLPSGSLCHYPPKVLKSLLAISVCSVAILLLPTTADAQVGRERLSIQAVSAPQPPRIDGVLDEQAWAAAPMIDEFTQQEPRLGSAATERTEVRVLFDSRHIYIGVHAFDSQPSSITATEMRRDSDRLLNEDSFQLILDTFNDSRNG